MMKKLIVPALICLTMAVQAHIEHQERKELVPDPDKVAKSRSCFLEAAHHGCGHPREDKDHFQACINTHISALSEVCQKTFLRLYGRRAP